MRFMILFHFDGDGFAVAATGADGEIADVLLPAVGDLVEHEDSQGKPFRGRVRERSFKYNVEKGHEVDGEITITLFLTRTTIH